MSNAIEEILTRWTNAEEIRLRAGEIDPETMRTVLAITRAMARQIREILKMGDQIQKGQCWQIRDAGDDSGVWIRGVDGDRIFVADASGNISEWSRDGLLEDGRQVKDD